MGIRQSLFRSSRVVRSVTIASLAAVALTVAACGTGTTSSPTTTEHVAQQGAESRSRPSLTISSQVSPSSIVVTSATLPEGGAPGEGGWLVVGTDDSGTIGSVLGSATIKEGTNHNVVIHVSSALPNGTYLVGLFRGSQVPTPGAQPLVMKPISLPSAG